MHIVRVHIKTYIFTFSRSIGKVWEPQSWFLHGSNGLGLRDSCCLPSCSALLSQLPRDFAFTGPNVGVLVFRKLGGNLLPEHLGSLVLSGSLKG